MYDGAAACREMVIIVPQPTYKKVKWKTKNSGKKKKKEKEVEKVIRIRIEEGEMFFKRNKCYDKKKETGTQLYAIYAL